MKTIHRPHRFCTVCKSFSAAVGLIFSALLSILIVTGCLGREKDAVVPQGRFTASALGLTRDMPRILVFGATWCKPCRKEIEAMNVVAQRYGSSVDVVGFLVEGAEKGSTPNANALQNFVSPRGEKSQYPVLLDPKWKRFDALSPAQGRSLPLVAFVSSSGKVVAVFQSSLDLESELLPAVEKFVRGETPVVPPVRDAGDATVPAVSTTPVPTAVPGPLPNGTPAGPSWCAGGCTVSVAEWSPRATPDVLANVRESWSQGLAESGFLEEEMPFETGIVALGDREGEIFPLSIEWKSVHNCTLTVWVKPDGTFRRAKGVCVTN